MRDTFDAFLLVDAQVDFFPGGALPVPHGDAILPAVNTVLELCREEDIPVIASADWHPANHASFVAAGGPWPPHCVRGTAGASLHPALELPPVFTMVHKATRADTDAYSAFDGGTLAHILRERSIRRLLVGGLALDYCVKASCLDAVSSGFEVALLLPATRAVEVTPGDGDRALAKLEAHGVTLIEQVPR
jgi:nicotinamidase/pyrazinamidase